MPILLSSINFNSKLILKYHLASKEWKEVARSQGIVASIVIKTPEGGMVKSLLSLYVYVIVPDCC